MKVNYLTLLAGATMVLLSAAAARAQESAATALAADAKAVPVASVGLTSTASIAPVVMPAGNTASYDDNYDPVADFVARAGAWGVKSTGSQVQTGKYQNLDSSAEFDVAGLVSGPDHSLNFEFGGSDNETSMGRAHYYGPNVEADLGFEQFQNQLSDHNFAGWNYKGVNNSVGPGYAPGSGTLGTGPGDPQSPQSIVLFSQNNLSPGLDSAITIQEYKANFKGNITDNLKWRLNVFGIDKEGVRQVSEFQHCSAAAGNGSTLPVALPPGGVNLPPYPKASVTQPTNNIPAADYNLTSQCHVTTQAQHIDWQTTELTPTLELRINADTFLEYSYTIRSFTANDQMVTFNYDTGVASYAPNSGAVTSATSGTPTTAAAQQTRQNLINGLTTGYGIVPDSQTEINRMKFSTALGDNTHAYLLGYVGSNEDQLRDDYRNFEGTDLRITNKSLEHWTTTVYGKYYNETTTNPTFALSPTSASSPSVAANNYYQEPNLAFFGAPTVASPSNIGPEINRQLSSMGFSERWRPFEDQYGTFASRLSIVTGYEYSSLKRENASYLLNQQSSALALTNPFLGTQGTNAVFKQPDTNKSTLTLGVEEKWSDYFSTFCRYKYIDTTYPLYGVTNQVSYAVAYAVNSNMPTQENRMETGFTWTPTDELMLNATIYVENAYSNAPYLTPWTSNSLPFTLSSWWAPTRDWSFSAGFSEMDSWINQSVNLGEINQLGPQNSALKVPWNYQGIADVITLGSRYQATEKLSFTGEFEFVRGDDINGATVNPANQVPSTAAPPYSTTPYSLGTYSNDKMTSYRFGIGADYRLRPAVTTYVRYNYYSYNDDTGITSGQASMILGGMSAKF